jgi:hypothetical protein
VSALSQIIDKKYLLEKHYCFLGFEQNCRNSKFLIDQINYSIEQINLADLGYQINDYFTLENSLVEGPIEPEQPGQRLNQDHFNNLHRYFEELQGTSGNISLYYNKADFKTRYHIRQLNLLCHEFEAWNLSNRRAITAPDWRRPSQLMCWLNAPRFALEPEDLELFGVDTLNRPLGGVFVGVNKAVGKHHWEVFNDEGRDSRIGELTTTALKSQTEAAADFDIEWGLDPSDGPWQKENLNNFRQWLVNNGFDPNDKSLTIGHPQIGQVDLLQSFGTTDHNIIWKMLNEHLDVGAISFAGNRVVYDYRWTDDNYIELQIERIQKGN